MNAHSLQIIFLTVVCAGMISCESKPTPTAAAPAVSTEPETDLFALLPNYQGRLRAEQSGTLRLYIIGGDGVKIASIDAKEIQGHLQGEEDTEGVRITMKPEPQAG